MKTAGGPVSLMVATVIVWGSVLLFGAVMAPMKVMAEQRTVVKGLTRMH